jgi:hypothetical protein
VNSPISGLIHSGRSAPRTRRPATEWLLLRALLAGAKIRRSGHRVKTGEAIALARRPKGRRPRMLLSAGTGPLARASRASGANP